MLSIFVDLCNYRVVYTLKKRHTKSERKSGSQQKSTSDPVRYTSSVRAQKKSFAKPLSKGAELPRQKDDYEVMESGQPLYEDV